MALGNVTTVLEKKITTYRRKNEVGKHMGIIRTRRCQHCINVALLLYLNVHACIRIVSTFASFRRHQCNHQACREATLLHQCGIRDAICTRHTGACASVGSADSRFHCVALVRLQSLSKFPVRVEHGMTWPIGP